MLSCFPVVADPSTVEQWRVPFPLAPASQASCRVSFPPCCSHAKVARIPFTLIFPDLSWEGQNLSSHSDLFRFSYWDQVLFFLCLQNWEFDWLIGCLVGVILFSFFLGIFDYILFCKGRTIPKKSLSPEIFIYLFCFREVLYLEGRSCALPSSGSLLIYPVFPLRVNSICPFPRVISDFPNFLTSVLLLNLKPKKKLQGCFLTSFSVSITFIKTNIAISLNILKYTQQDNFLSQSALHRSQVLCFCESRFTIARL